MGLCTVDNFSKVCLSIGVQNANTVTKSKIAVFSSTNNDEVLMGFGALLVAAAKVQKEQNLMGNSKETEAVVRQWLEYAVCKVNFMDTHGTTCQVLKDLNNTLSEQTYIAGNIFTLVDVTFYHLLYRTISKLSLQEKEQYVHLSRWYSNLQQDVNIRGGNMALTFSRTLLY